METHNGYLQSERTENGEKVDADVLRDQFNSLNDYSTALDKRGTN